MKNREEAWTLLTTYTQSPSLLKHAQAVEAAMRAYAGLFGEDEQVYGLTGLLHDFDYERWPSASGHPFEGSKILAAEDYPPELIEAILGHAEYTGVPRRTRLAKTLFACDELCGLVMACALVRPDHRIAELQLSSVRKKFKDKSFAKGVARDDVLRGIEELETDFDRHTAVVLAAMQSIAPELELG